MKALTGRVARKRETGLRESRRTERWVLCWMSGGKKLNTLAGVEGPCLGTRRNENEEIGQSGEGMKRRS